MASVANHPWCVRVCRRSATFCGRSGWADYVDPGAPPKHSRDNLTDPVRQSEDQGWHLVKELRPGMCAVQATWA